MSQSGDYVSIKTKLDKIWNDVQNNLPEINFEEPNTNINVRDDFELIETPNYDFEVDDNYDDDDDEFVAKKVNKNNNKETADEWLENEKIFEKYLNHNNVDDELNFMSETASLSEVEINSNHIELQNLSRNITNNNTAHISSATKITKSIFDSTSSKLNMEIFDSINFDDMIASIKSNESSTIQTKSPLIHLKSFGKSSSSSSCTLKDEAVLKKLAEMSSSLLKNDEELNHLDLKTGAAISNKLKMNNFCIKNDSINLIENQLNLNTRDSEEMIRNDLKKYLSAHNMKDGNLVETRRIDLRQSQIERKASANNKFTNNNPVEAFLAMNLNPLSVKSKKPFRFLNEKDQTSSESSGESDEENNTLWFERYRQQKNALNNKIKS